MFLYDNGYHLGSHALGNKITMHEESVRMPMFVFGAGVTSRETTQALVSTLDLYLTLLELSGASKPLEPIMGSSLLPLLKDTGAPHYGTVFSECVGFASVSGVLAGWVNFNQLEVIVHEMPPQVNNDRNNAGTSGLCVTGGLRFQSK
ncbi:hypothetical protein DDZ13_07545 [Coraliomargarita sinensis]|uniref:N-sulphoglucosamine sulphohydrolase C-terminal domain-containing protein n=1 Tax=Coraliomargarita sinensis TaxID=2174842 RepID=A0A317ZJG2_9BACT|nr:sulfatase/phosphatase domain-containing protein [Coraliomargarita sinensis]PXA04377.1 hypothetical protein DDZ13_07545 [Coraliomargarita sinensis]